MPEGLSDEKTIQAIQENPYLQYLLGLPKFTEKPVFVPELFVQIRKRLDQEFFNLLTLLLSEADGSKPKKVHTDEDGNDHGGTMKVDATCCDAEVRYPTDYNLLEDGSELTDRLLDKFCARHKAEKPRTHRVEARQAFISLTKKKRKGKKLVDKVRLIQLRCPTANRPTSPCNWNSIKSASACCHRKSKRTSSTSGRRTGILSRQEEGHRREERGGGHIRNLQKGLPGKRHQGET